MYIYNYILYYIYNYIYIIIYISLTVPDEWWMLVSTVKQCIFGDPGMGAISGHKNGAVLTPLSMGSSYSLQ